VGAGCDIGAVEVDARPDGLVRADKAGDPLLGDGIYEDDGTGQTRTQTKAKKKSAKYVVRAQSDAAFQSEAMLVSGPAGNAGFKVKYLDAGVDVTAAVTGAGYTLTPALAPGGVRDLQVKVKVTKNASSGQQLALLVDVGSTAVPGRADTVGLVTKAK
jgi:hypothetical protein